MNKNEGGKRAWAKVGDKPYKKINTKVSSGNIDIMK